MFWHGIYLFTNRKARKRKGYPSHSVPTSYPTILVLFVCFLIPCTVILSHSQDVWVCLFIFHVLDETEWPQGEKKDV